MLAEGLAVGQDIDVQFSLKLSEQFTNTWNINLPEWMNAPSLALDYNVVATQPGIAPGA